MYTIQYNTIPYIKVNPKLFILSTKVVCLGAFDGLWSKRITYLVSQSVKAMLFKQSRLNQICNILNLTSLNAAGQD